MSRANNTRASITPTQIFCVCAASSLLGLQLYSPFTPYPAGTQWIFALAADAAIIIISLLLYGYAMRRTGADDITSLLSHVLSPLPSRIIMLPVGCGCVCSATLALGVQAVQINNYLLEKTPVAVVLLVLLAAGTVLCTGDAQSLSRTAEIIILILLIPLAVVLIAGIIRTDLGEIRILLKPKPSALPSQLIPAALSVSGAQCALFMHTKADEKSMCCKGAVLATVACTVIASVYYSISAGVLTIDGMSLIQSPFIEASRLINIGGITLTERFDMIFILLRLFCIIIQAAVLVHCAVTAFCFTFNTHRRIPVLFVVSIVVFALSLFQTRFAHLLWLPALAGAALTLPVLAVITTPLLFLKRRHTA